MPVIMESNNKQTYNIMNPIKSNEPIDKESITSDNLRSLTIMKYTNDKKTFDEILKLIKLDSNTKKESNHTDSPIDIIFDHVIESGKKSDEISSSKKSKSNMRKHKNKECRTTRESKSNIRENKNKECSKQIPKTIKSIVWNKYIGKEKGIGECYVCKGELDSKHFEAGHIIARANGGENSVENLRPICSLCNKSIGSKNIDEFKRSYLLD